MPKLVFRLYCLLKEDNTEITKSKNRHILCEKNGILENTPWSDLMKLKRPDASTKFSLWKLSLKNIFQNHPIPMVISLLANVWGYTIIYYLFLSDPSNNILIYDEKITVS